MLLTLKSELINATPPFKKIILTIKILTENKLYTNIALTFSYHYKQNQSLSKQIRSSPSHANFQKKEIWNGSYVMDDYLQFESGVSIRYD